MSKIENVITGFKKPRVQYMSIFHSDALSPIEMGTFTGSVKAMATSPDFTKSFEKFFKLKNLGLWWAYPRSDLARTKDTNRWVMHYELDRTDVNEGKNDIIMAYFAKHSSMVDNNFFGTAMSIVPVFKPMLDDEVKIRITKNAKKQAIIGKSLKSITLGGTQILNWADSKKENTLHRQLMCVESIHDKFVLGHHDAPKTTFKGRLFYAIAPNQRTKMVTYYFSTANYDEASSVAHGLPLFIKDHFKLKPSFFCGSDDIAICLEGEWNYAQRTFLTLDEKNEKEKFSHIIDTVTTVKEVFISEAQRAAMAIEGDDVATLDTKLTKGDQAPPAAESVASEGMSDLTGHTRESKAKAYAAEASKKVASQYISSIDNMKVEHNQAMTDLMEKLCAAELKLESNNNVEVEEERTTDKDEDSDAKEDGNEENSESNKTIDVSSDNNDANMSGLSLTSSSNENEPIMNNIKRKRRERTKNQQLRSEGEASGTKSPNRKSSRINRVTPGKISRHKNNSTKSPPAASDSSGMTL